MALFLRTLETTLAEGCTALIRLVLAQRAYREIAQAKVARLAALREGVTRLLISPGTFAVALVLSAIPLLAALGRGPVAMLVC